MQTSHNRSAISCSRSPCSKIDRCAPVKVLFSIVAVDQAALQRVQSAPPPSSHASAHPVQTRYGHPGRGHQRICLFRCPDGNPPSHNQQRRRSCCTSDSTATHPSHLHPPDLPFARPRPRPRSLRCDFPPSTRQLEGHASTATMVAASAMWSRSSTRQRRIAPGSVKVLISSSRSVFIFGNSNSPGVGFA